ncbi:unnamed protein product [Pleuronectes platessa]|uniref:Uncharacterized protein n=1 Tax=Pleuronectes platessa TaxID=8262 RepID=A0A9N7YR07_PLEPL|nr:unnamed protein product [Pleuronectes platessa]
MPVTEVNSRKSFADLLKEYQWLVVGKLPRGAGGRCRDPPLLQNTTTLQLPPNSKTLPLMVALTRKQTVERQERADREVCPGPEPRQHQSTSSFQTIDLACHVVPTQQASTTLQRAGSSPS